jgi:hypothetical protein
MIDFYNADMYCHDCQRPIWDATGNTKHPTIWGKIVCFACYRKWINAVIEVAKVWTDDKTG